MLVENLSPRAAVHHLVIHLVRLFGLDLGDVYLFAEIGLEVVGEIVIPPFVEMQQLHANHHDGGARRRDAVVRVIASVIWSPFALEQWLWIINLTWIANARSAILFVGFFHA